MYIITLLYYYYIHYIIIIYNVVITCHIVVVNFSLIIYMHVINNFDFVDKFKFKLDLVYSHLWPIPSVQQPVRALCG